MVPRLETSRGLVGMNGKSCHEPIRHQDLLFVGEVSGAQVIVFEIFCRVFI